MIIRTYFKCLTCDQPHIVRIGLGQEAYQDHRFPCTECQEQMHIALHLSPGPSGESRIEAIDNAERTGAVEDAPVVNVDANFLVPKDERHVDMAFPRMDQMDQMLREAQKAAQDKGFAFPAGSLSDQPLRKPDFHAEWKLLKKAWSLHRSGRDKLSGRKLSEASETFYKSEPLKSLHDWLFRFVTFLTQPALDARFEAVVDELRPLIGKAELTSFLAVYETELRLERSTRYFDLLKSFFSAYSDFSQVLFLVTHGAKLDETNAASTVNFDATRMFYGNAFEAFASSVDVLAYLNNIVAGRPFDTFQSLTRTEYLKLDKAGRCNAFAANKGFSALCEEFDNQLRNASHHGGFIFDAANQVITYRAGKGGMGPEHKISYVTYLRRSTALFLNAITLFRAELLLCHVTKCRPPI